MKNITTGEGGAICVNDDAVAAKLRSLRHHGIERSGYCGDLAASESSGAWYHEFHAASTNERLSDLQCALGASQCRRIDTFKAARAAQVERYRRELPAGVQAPVAAPEQAPFWHICSAQVNWAAPVPRRWPRRARPASRSWSITSPCTISRSWPRRGADRISPGPTAPTRGSSPSPVIPT